MSKIWYTRALLCVIAAGAPFSGIAGCERLADTDQIVIVSYNVRGTFGNRVERAAKAEQIALALQELGLDNSDIILFQEIDDRDLIHELVTQHLVLSAFRYAVTAPSSGSAITQAVISKHPLTEARTHAIAHEGISVSRGILEVTAHLPGGELVLYNAHLKSKRGGVAATEPQRAATMRALRTRLQERLAAPNPPAIIIAGDMNSTPRAPTAPPDTADSPEAAEAADVRPPVALLAYPAEPQAEDGLRIAQLEDAPALWQDDAPAAFVSPWQDAEWPGTYYFRGQWDQIDHFFLSSALFDGAGIEYHDFAVALTAEERAAGANAEKDDRSFASTSAASDHLPIVLTIIVR